MMVIFFRHGPAGEADPSRWPDDTGRPLTPEGIEKTRKAASGLARLLTDHRTMVFTSPLARAEQTARLLAEALDPPAPLHVFESLAPGGSLPAVLTRLAGVEADAAVLVGHQPGLGRMAGAMVAGSNFEIPLKKAGACAVLFDGRPAQGRGELKWVATPRMLRALGRRGPVSP